MTYWERWRLGYWGIGAAGALLVVLVLLLLSAYLLPSSWNGVRSVRDMLPLPIALVEGQPAATYADVSDNLLALRIFYESQDFSSLGLRVDFSTPEGQDRLRIREREIINKMVEDAAIRRLSAGRGIAFSDADAVRAVLEEANMADGEAAARENVARLYGWDLERFAHEIVLPDLYRDVLETAVMDEEGRFREAAERAARAEKMLSDGRTFSDVASEFSEGRTADAGGSMGWFAYDQLIAPLRDQARTAEIGVPSRVIESDLGFHILLVNGRQTEGDRELADVSQIFVRKETFGEWLTEEMKRMSIRVLAPEYVWDREAATVEFRDASLRALERELLERSEGDASVMF